MSLQHAIVKHLLQDPISLAEIVNLTETSMPTIRRAIQLLEDSDWIHVVGQAEANGGRPAKLYGINNQRYMVFGLHFQLPGARLIATDLSGNILEELVFFRGQVPEPSQTIRVVANAIQEIKDKLPNRIVLGLGIAIPGFVDLSTGDIIQIRRVPSWVNFPICRRLSEATGLPVQIANDVDCMAFAEFYHDREPVNNNLVYIAFCEGVKASLFLGGELYKGSIGNVGLISSDLLNIGKHQDREEVRRLITMLGFNQIFEEKVARLAPSQQAAFIDLLNMDDQRERLIMIMNRALEEPLVCLPMVMDLIEFIATAIANIIFMLQPDMIVIGGSLTTLPEKLFIMLDNAIRDRIPTLISNNLIIKQGVMESLNNAALGAIHHFLKENLQMLLDDV